MSAFPDSGHSDHEYSQISKGSFRPEAASHQRLAFQFFLLVCHLPALAAIVTYHGPTLRISVYFAHRARSKCRPPVGSVSTLRALIAKRPLPTVEIL